MRRAACPGPIAGRLRGGAPGWQEGQNREGDRCRRPIARGRGRPHPRGSSTGCRSGAGLLSARRRSPASGPRRPAPLGDLGLSHASEKPSESGLGCDPGVLSGQQWGAVDASATNGSHFSHAAGRAGGDGGIRTLDTHFWVCSFSKRVPSAARPRLRRSGSRRSDRAGQPDPGGRRPGGGARSAWRCADAARSRSSSPSGSRRCRARNGGGRDKP